jgi:hypothetical protein
MSVITILDFTNGTIDIHPIDDDKIEINDGGEEILNELGYNAENCQWLVTDKLNLTIHEI